MAGSLEGKVVLVTGGGSGIGRPVVGEKGVAGVANSDADRRVYQFVAKDGGDLHRQQVSRIAQVGPDEDLKMPVLAALIIPTLAYAPAATAA